MFPDKKPNDFNFEKFCNFLVKDSELINVYYYNVPLDIMHDKEKYIKQQQFFDKIKRIPKFIFRLCRMQKRKVGNHVIYEVKEDDIYLAVDMVKLACQNSYDTAILVSSDGDFVPAVKAVQETGKKVEDVGFKNKFSYHLKHECDNFILLDNEVLNQFFI
jgi:uncharacterized LabA/DUF88 family protein